MFPNPQNRANLRWGPLGQIMSASTFVKKKLPNDSFTQIFIVLIHYRSMILFICDALHDLTPFVESKKREKHPCRSVTFSKVVGLSSLQLY